VTLYVNGVEEESQTFSLGLVPTNPLPLRIGADSDGMHRFVGIVDEVRVFSRALSAAEIQTIFQQGGMTRCP
jgi:Concanavalin A-like lectin/glucanases superfamily